MAKVFEDEFSEVQTNMIGLCGALLRCSNEPVDWIYAHCHNDETTAKFDAFFVAKGKPVRKEELGIRLDTLEEFLRVGIKGAVRLKMVCIQYGRPCPVDVYMIYNKKTGKFQAMYGYDPAPNGSGQKDPFDEWFDEVRLQLAKGMPAGLLPNQAASQSAAPQQKSGGVWDRIMRKVAEAKAKRK